MTEAPPAKRAYRSVRRQQQAADTRALVLSAATRLFTERGWAGTGMRDIAAEAGVSMVPLYAHFASKGDLLAAAIDVGVVGDAESVPLAERPEFAALAAGSLSDRISTAAALLTGINQRTVGLRRALVEGAGADAQLAAKLHQLETRRRHTLAAGAALIVGRPVADDVLDALWVLTVADGFHLLTEVGGRSAEDYEQWLAATIRRLVEPS